MIVASNLFGDILTDIGVGDLRQPRHRAGRATSTPSGRYPSMFEPIHGSAPDIAGKGIANPIGAIWAGALMLDHLGHRDLHDRIRRRDRARRGERKESDARPRRGAARRSSWRTRFAPRSERRTPNNAQWLCMFCQCTMHSLSIATVGVLARVEHDRPKNRDKLVSLAHFPRHFFAIYQISGDQQLQPIHRLACFFSRNTHFGDEDRVSSGPLSILRGWLRSRSRI